MSVIKLPEILGNSGKGYYSQQWPNSGKFVLYPTEQKTQSGTITTTRDYSSGLYTTNSGNVSGYQIGSGLVVSPLIFSSGAIICGSVSMGGYFGTCASCNKQLSAQTVGDQITVTGMSGLYRVYCWQCANYNSKTGFESREDWIRQNVPQYDGMPCNVLADWCEDQGRLKDAEWLRTHRSGR